MLLNYSNMLLYHQHIYLSQFPQVIECSQGIQLLQGYNQSLGWRWVHKVEMYKVIDAQWLQ